jgi:hypothetical protein
VVTALDILHLLKEGANNYRIEFLFFIWHIFKSFFPVNNYDASALPPLKESALRVVILDYLPIWWSKFSYYEYNNFPLTKPILL